MANNYSYMISKAVQAELSSIGVDLIEIEGWPALSFPNGLYLLIGMDDEGNGPGAIHTHRIDPASGQLGPRLSH